LSKLTNALGKIQEGLVELEFILQPFLSRERTHQTTSDQTSRRKVHRQKSGEQLHDQVLQSTHAGQSFLTGEIKRTLSKKLKYRVKGTSIWSALKRLTLTGQIKDLGTQPKTNGQHKWLRVS
jgi:hypothetical protein